MRSATPGDRVTRVELFFDLVFVFALTQLSHHLLGHLSWVGAGETFVILLAVYKVWVRPAVLPAPFRRVPRPRRCRTSRRYQPRTSPHPGPHGCRRLPSSVAGELAHAPRSDAQHRDSFTGGKVSCPSSLPLEMPVPSVQCTTSGASRPDHGNTRHAGCSRRDHGLRNRRSTVPTPVPATGWSGCNCATRTVTLSA